MANTVLLRGKWETAAATAGLHAPLGEMNRQAQASLSVGAPEPRVARFSEETSKSALHVKSPQSLQSSS